MTPIVKDLWAPIFSTGHHGGVEWTPDHLARMCANYDLLRTDDGGGVLPPIRVGHIDSSVTDAAAVARDQLADGFVSGLKLSEDGQRLLARLAHVSPEVRGWIAQRKLLRVSPEIIKHIERSSIAKNLGERGAAARGPAVIGLALLGSQRPECVDLPAIPDISDETSGVTTMQFRATELQDGADALDAHQHVATVEHHLRGGVDHLAQAMRIAGDLKDRYGKTAADDVLSDTSGEADNDPDDTHSLHERVRRAENMLSTIQQRNRAAEVVLAETSTPRAPQPMRFAAFDADVADDIDELGAAFLAELEGALQQQGLNREDVSARRRVAQELLASWKSRTTSESAAGATLADQLSPSDFTNAVEHFAPGPSFQSRFTRR